jgi:Na+:H+ antiporter, NhaA family
LLTNFEIKIIDAMEGLSENVQSPLQTLEHKLHGWIAYAILPIFALANAGIVFSSDIFNNLSLSIILAVSLIVGNIVGVTLTTFLGVKLKITSLPEGVDFSQIVGIGCLAGLGFTMSIFITNLAFVEPQFINAAKFGILIGSIIAGILGYAVLNFALNKKPAPAKA